jgi:hypothetical protein
LLAAVHAYAAACTADGRESRFIKHPATFLGPNKPYEDFIDNIPEATPEVCGTCKYGPTNHKYCWYTMKNMPEDHEKCEKYEQGES